ncbi:hypothetical protein B9Z42_01550 [Limnohabitans sp. B9-3]|nr:hypothetical protein B9Z42_01550 [Limnohabitans sp. B9-3]
MHDKVCSNEYASHYLKFTRKEVFIDGICKYSQYIFPKQASDYRLNPVRTAIDSAKISVHQFDEVCSCFLQCLKKHGYKAQVGDKIMHDLLYLTEEIRSLKDEMAPSLIGSKDFTSEFLEVYLKRKRYRVLLEEGDLIHVVEGLPHPIMIMVNKKDKVMNLIGRLDFLKDENALAMKFIDWANSQIKFNFNEYMESFSPLKWKLISDEGDNFALTHHKIDFKDGVPLRLFDNFLFFFSYELDKIIVADNGAAFKSGEMNESQY